jgi:hypothetical protein
MSGEEGECKEEGEIFQGKDMRLGVYKYSA